MSKIDIIRAWKDEEYRQSLSESERALLPPHPAGVIELSDADLRSAVGGLAEELAYTESYGLGTFGCCRTVISGCGTHNLGGWSFGCCQNALNLNL